MCGICGVHDPSGIDRTDVERMVHGLRHRGPDDSGLELTPRAALGHTRLSIIGLETGHQPISNEDDTIWITFNGEIYNYRELASELKPRHRFKTDSDTEVILHLYEEEGEACLRRLRGMFAFAIYDSRRDKIFAARDHMGQKPFFYSHTGGRFSFSSEIKGLLALDPSLRRLAPEALSEYLGMRIITPPRTMFRDIRKLPPGHKLRYQDGKLEIERYWNLRFEPKRSGDFASALDELDQRLQQSVEYHLVSDVPVGAFLSGGLDSSLIVAMMSRLTDEPIKTFTGDLPYGERSELPFARLVSERYGTKSHELTIRPSLVEDLPRVIFHLDEPSDPLSTCVFALAAFTRPQVKVVLGGDGGDELFAGYDRYYGHRYAGYLAWMPRFLREQVLQELLKRLPRSNWYRGTSHKLGWLLDMARYSGATRYAKSLRYFYFSDDDLQGLLTDSFRASVGAFDPDENIRRHFDAVDAKEVVDRMLYADSATRLPDHPVMISDRMTMAHGLEARSPFLDHELVEFCASLPPSFKIRGTRRRVIQAELAKRYLPEQILNRGKQGFSSAFTYMLADDFDRLYATFLQDSVLASSGILNPDWVRQLLAEQQSGQRDHGQRLWLLYNSELWYRLFIESQSVEDVQDQVRNALSGGRPERRNAVGVS
jgi:asparagine synthase (glutamine-hydrolysing)